MASTPEANAQVASEAAGGYQSPPAGLAAFFLVGPTAVGKTAVAEWIAAQQGWALLSADSMLVYRGMDVGTSKPGPDARARLAYYGLDLAEPAESFSVWPYRRHALRALEECAARGVPVIVTGGTGLYVKSLTHGLDERAAPDAARRAHWERILSEGGVPALQEALRGLNPAALEALADPLNPRRLLRAIEASEAGTPPAASPSWRAMRPAGTPLVGLARRPEDLKSRIESRVADMYRHGFLDEVQALRDVSGALPPAARRAIGYEEALEAVTGRCSIEQAMERTAARTRQLARRQMTWFRHQADVVWVAVEPDMACEAVGRRVLEVWRQHGPTRIAA